MGKNIECLKIGTGLICKTQKCWIKCTKYVSIYSVSGNTTVKANYVENEYAGYDEDTKLHKINIKGYVGTVVEKECWLTEEQLIEQFTWEGKHE